MCRTAIERPRVWPVHTWRAGSPASYREAMDDDPQYLAGRTALVTGGAGGIGAAVCARLAGVGAHVVVVDLDPVGAAQVAKDVGGDHVVMDLTDGDAIDALELDVDVLVNNAGV